MNIIEPRHCIYPLCIFYTYATFASNAALHNSALLVTLYTICTTRPILPPPPVQHRVCERYGNRFTMSFVTFQLMLMIDPTWVLPCMVQPLLYYAVSRPARFLRWCCCLEVREEESLFAHGGHDTTWTRFQSPICMYIKAYSSLFIGYTTSRWVVVALS